MVVEVIKVVAMVVLAGVVVVEAAPGDVVEVVVVAPAVVVKSSK